VQLNSCWSPLTKTRGAFLPASVCCMLLSMLCTERTEKIDYHAILNWLLLKEGSRFGFVGSGRGYCRDSYLQS
jgi:hypothetical protein